VRQETKANAKIKETPLIYTGEMVRAILEDRKWQTRRLNGLKKINESPDSWILETTTDIYYGAFTALLAPSNHRMSDKAEIIKCPFGALGDRLWVRETFQEYRWDGIRQSNIRYRADHPGLTTTIPWKPSIHMFRWASRITQEITGLRIERLQEISLLDIIAEGVVPLPLTEETNPKPRDGRIIRERFRTLWDSLNAKRGYGWDVNPWVWVIEFKRIDAT